MYLIMLMVQLGGLLKVEQYELVCEYWMNIVCRIEKRCRV